MSVLAVALPGLPACAFPSARSLQALGASLAVSVLAFLALYGFLGFYGSCLTAFLSCHAESSACLLSSPDLRASQLRDKTFLEAGFQHS